MNLVTIAEHTIDISLINRESKVLDLGCRAFTWSKAMLEYVDEIYCVDADPEVPIPDKPLEMIRGAVMDSDGESMFLKCSGNGTGNYILYNGAKKNELNGVFQIVKTISLKTISDIANVELWDIIKCDIEGSEIPVLLDLKKPPAKQLSIEFHVHTGSTQEQVYKVVTHLEELGYECCQHEYSSQHGAGFNYWDSLFILK